MSINVVVLSGNVTRDPELRSTQTGTEVLSFGLAVNDRRKNPGTGEWEDHPNFVDCTIFGTRASSLADRIFKGTRISLQGKLRWSQWERDGQKRSKLDVIADEIVLMAGTPSTAPAPYSPPKPVQKSMPVIDATAAAVYDDIPF